MGNTDRFTFRAESFRSLSEGFGPEVASLKGRRRARKLGVGEGRRGPAQRWPGDFPPGTRHPPPRAPKGSSDLGTLWPRAYFFIASRSEVRFGGMQSRQAVNG